MFLSLIKKRRSIRKFRDQPVEEKKIERLVEAALRAPSSMGRNPWEFIVVNDRDCLAKLSQSKPHGSTFLKGAPLGIVVCGDPVKCDVWVEDCAIASIFIHLAAESLGLGSCWIQIRERMHNDKQTAGEYVSQLLNIPEHLEVESIVAVGYPDEQKPGHKKETLLFDHVHRNAYGNKWGRN
ncbi:MAG: nitroreductase family protein [Candidatus Aminicenantes bacterium]|nr:nitroreductase family protein [Candidatus Aminicenantes bacterium]